MLKVLAYLYFMILKLRYKFEIHGLEQIEPKKQYVIFPNHQALVDPQIVVSVLYQKIKVSPVISETYYNIPVLKQFFKMLGAVSMGDVRRGKSLSDDIQNNLNDIQDGIKNKKNILLYPAGQLYSQGYESIKGKKSAYNIVKNLPDNVEILLVKTTGLWGSMWSKARIGDTPPFFETFFKAFFIIISNLFFFVPKRNVKIEIKNMTNELKSINDINLFNKKLEDFYNSDGEEKLRYIKHFFFYDDVKNKSKPDVIKGSVEYFASTSSIDENIIPNDIKQKIIMKISEMKKIPSTNITTKSILVTDLFFDSLDIAELKSFVQINFPNSSNPPITDIKNVLDVCIMAIGKSPSIEQLKPCKWSFVKDKDQKLFDIITKNKQKLNENASIISLFKEIFKTNKSESFVYDNIFGLQTKQDFLIKAYLISSFIKSINSKYIGVMLPSLSSTSLIIIAIYLADKIPVMLNWTVGEKALLHCINFANIDYVLTSKNFYDKIKNNGTEKIKDKYIFLEDMLKYISLFKKVKAFVEAWFFKIPKINYDDNAVLLFTSGSESLPKAVPLTHKNIISDIIGALYNFPLIKDDILIGFLPPFHSFGFTINTIMPLVSGLRVVYTPDPNDSKTISNLIAHCNVNSVTSTPTFLKMILNVATKDELKNLKYAVVGAEKCPEDLVEKFKLYCPNGKIMEGYGITECSPVISINPPDKIKLGSVGKVIYGGQVMILSIDDGSILGKNKQGMIYYTGDNVFDGYLDKTLEVPFTQINGKKYYKTGDLGYLDDDGYLFITGRLKRFVKIAGEMISLPFVEGILSKKYSKDGLNIAIEALEKDGIAKIVLFSTKDLQIDEVNSYLRENGVSNLVKIDQIQVLEDLPVLGTGKIDYKLLKSMIQI